MVSGHVATPAPALAALSTEKWWTWPSHLATWVATRAIGSEQNQLLTTSRKCLCMSHSPWPSLVAAPRDGGASSSMLRTWAWSAPSHGQWWMLLAPPIPPQGAPLAALSGDPVVMMQDLLLVMVWVLMTPVFPMEVTPARRGADECVANVRTPRRSPSHAACVPTRAASAGLLLGTCAHTHRGEARRMQRVSLLNHPSLGSC